jgi:lysosomal acid lipase/cholesteryl ester hydrolase
MYDDVQPRVPYLSSTRSHCPHPIPTNQITTPIAIFYGGNDSLVDIKSLLSDLPKLVGVWEVPAYEHLGKSIVSIFFVVFYHTVVLLC